MTTEQAIWLKEYYRMWSRAHLASKLGISEATLSKWLTELGLKKKKDGRRTVPIVHKAAKPMTEKKIISRPPARYDNSSREQHVERILNIQL